MWNKTVLEFVNWNNYGCSSDKCICSVQSCTQQVNMITKFKEGMTEIKLRVKGWSESNTDSPAMHCDPVRVGSAGQRCITCYEVMKNEYE